ncbi:MAG: hypothetical protein IJB44_03125 [Clostridia bacterium]|nr:hypothetical protein [Clostridia bacterium]
MKTIFLIPFLIFILIFSIAGCSSGDGLSLPADQLELLPENFPLDSCPFYCSEEIVSVISKGSDSFFSYEIIFNSGAEYQEIVDFYVQCFPSAITKDFGIAYNLLSVPASSGGYMCNFNIYSDITHGEKGKCTVIVTVSEY